MNQEKIRIEPRSKRRYITRSYSMVANLIRTLFDIPSNEMVLDVKWNKERNELEIETLMYWNESEGDI